MGRHRSFLAAVLLAAATLLVTAGRALERYAGGAPPAPPATAAPATTRTPDAPVRRHEPAAPEPALDRLEEPLRSQVARVIEAMDRTGRPPQGVAQGGREKGRKGAFENAEGKLPSRPRGYYTETDVWPRRKGEGRGPVRLVFGAEGEVYYSGDHYRSFQRVR